MEDNNNPSYLKGKGDELFKLGDYAAAIHYYEEAIKQDPHYIQAWNNLGYSFLKLGREEDAARCRNKKKELESVRKEIFPEIVHDNTHNEQATQTRDADQSSQFLQPEELLPDHPVGESPDEIKKENQYNNRTKIFGKFWEFSGKIIHSKRVRIGEEALPEKEPFKGNLSEIPGELRIVVALCLIIGVCLCAILLIQEKQNERFTQFYLIGGTNSDSPSVQPESNSFTYGVKSYENEMMQYQLNVYANADLVYSKSFSLDPGEVREEKVFFKFDKKSSDSTTKINITLNSRYSTYDLHYWI